ncbi:MAG: EamA family transporter, partial [Bacteroidetes bacterium]
FSGQELVGILLVLLAVTMVILTRALERGVRGIFRWMRPRHA